MNEMRKLMETVEEGMFGKAPPSAVENEMTMDEIVAIGEQQGISEDDVWKAVVTAHDQDKYWEMEMEVKAPSGAVVGRFDSLTDIPLDLTDPETGEEFRTLTDNIFVIYKTNPKQVSDMFKWYKEFIVADKKQREHDISFNDWLGQNPFESIDEDEYDDDTDGPLVSDEIYNTIVADMEKNMPGYKPGAMGLPSDKPNQVSVMAWNSETDHEVDMMFNIDTMSFEGTGDNFMLDNPFEGLEEDEPRGVNDKYDDETLNCKHCGDYFCTSKFGGECPKIQRDLFDEEDKNSELEETFGDWMDDLTAPSDEREHRYDHDPSFHDDVPISAQVKSLLAQGKSVISRISGASGVVYSANPEDGTIVFKDQNFGEKISLDVDSKTGLEIQGFVDHYAIVPNVDEGKWDYKKRDKGRGAGTDSPMYDGGAKNRKNRKAFRKAEKAKAHAARMRGEVNEGVGRVVEVPPELRGNSELTGSATSEDAMKFIADLGPDDQVSHEVVDPETGELLDWPSNFDIHGQKRYTKRERGKTEWEKKQARLDAREVPMLSYYSDNRFGEAQDSAWEFLSDLRASDFYNVVWRETADSVEDPDMMRDNDYDIDVEVPALLKRKDGKKLTSDDHDNIEEIMKAVKAASTLGNIGIGYAGATDGGTTARFHPMFM